MISTPPTSDPTPLPTSTKAAAAPKQTPFTFIIPRWSKSIIWAMAPVTATNIIGLAFNIYCLKLVDASYFQVARGLTLPMTVVLQSLTTGEKPTMGTIASCGLVTWGFTYSFIPSPFGQSASTPQTGIASTEAPMLGMALGVAAAAMVAIHAILIKQALKVLDGRTLDL
jgi:GDP-fucose transporter C1